MVSLVDGINLCPSFL